MTTDTSQEPGDNGQTAPPPETDPGCDPQLIDDMACKASGVAAQAAYNATYQEQLATARQDYDKIRKEYRTTRHEAVLQVQDLRHEVKHLIERIKCLIEQKRVWRCIDKAFCKIVDELEGCCPDDIGCCAGECEYDVGDVACIGCDQIAQRIADYQQRTDQSKECFTKLVGEPAALAARVAAAKAAIDAIKEALSADPASTDLKKVYAQALVAKRDIDRIWNGFDQTHDFVDCLCRALTCWSKGCAAVSELVGAKAVCDCKAKRKADRCEHLKTSTVDEILAMYDKLCPPQDCDDPGGGRPKPEHEGCDECCDDHHDVNDDCHDVDDEDDDDEDCGDDDDDDDDEAEVCDKCGKRHTPRPRQQST